MIKNTSCDLMVLLSVPVTVISLDLTLVLSLFRSTFCVLFKIFLSKNVDCSQRGLSWVEL